MLPDMNPAEAKRLQFETKFFVRLDRPIRHSPAAALNPGTPDAQPTVVSAGRCRQGSQLAGHYLRALDPSGRIAGIDHQLGLLHDLLVVVVGMIGHDQYTVVLAEVVERGPLHLQVVDETDIDRYGIR